MDEDQIKDGDELEKDIVPLKEEAELDDPVSDIEEVEEVEEDDGDGDDKDDDEEEEDEEDGVY